MVTLVWYLWALSIRFIKASLDEPLLQLARIPVEWLGVLGKVSKLWLFKIPVFCSTVWPLESPCNSCCLSLYSLVHVLSICNLIFCQRVKGVPLWVSGIPLCSFLFCVTLYYKSAYFISAKFQSIPVQLIKTSEICLQTTSLLCCTETNWAKIRVVVVITT